MSINEKAQPQGNAFTQAAGVAGAAGQVDNSTVDFAELMSSGSALFSPRSASETLEKLGTAITDFLKAKFNGEMPKDWFLVKVDAGVHNLPASVISLVAVTRNGQVGRAYATNLLLESTKVNLSQTQAQGEGGRALVVTTTLGQAFDDRAWGIVQKRIAETLNVAQTIVQEVSSLIVPKDFDLTDGEALGRLVYLATVASSIGKQGGPKKKLNLAAAGLQQQRFVTDIDFTAQPKIDLLGRPVRNDMTVITSVQDQVDRNASYQQEQKLIELSAFVDLNYTQPMQLPQQFPGQPAVFGTQVYRPEIVIADQVAGFNDFDLGRSLFVLASASVLEKGSQWIRTFMRAGSGKKGVVNLNDIGAIGYELDVTGGKAIPTSRDVFSTKDLADLVGTYFHQNPLISMDIDPNGPYNWVLNEFLAAGVRAPDAEARIVAAANELTGGQFSSFWKGGVICQTRHTLHAGTYVNDANEVVSLDHIGYLAALNIFGPTDAESFKRWVDTFENANMSEIERLAIREELLRGRLSSVEITGYKRRVTFNKDFLIALESAMCAVGYHPNPKNAQPVFGPQVVRGVGGLDQLAGSGAWGQSMYSNQQQTVRGGGSIGGRFTSFGG